MEKKNRRVRVGKNHFIRIIVWFHGVYILPHIWYEKALKFITKINIYFSFIVLLFTHLFT